MTPEQLDAIQDRAENGDPDYHAHANAIEDRRYLLAYVRGLEARNQRARELHVPVMQDGNEVGCAMCDWEHPAAATWPCGTIAALTATEAQA